jgi:glutathione S-transferase
MEDWLFFAAREMWAAREARQAALFPETAAQPSIAAARRALDLMEDHMTERALAGVAWFVGAAPSLADIALLPGFALSRDWGQDHEPLPKLRRWSSKMRALPGFVTMPGIPDYG